MAQEDDQMERRIASLHKKSAEYTTQLGMVASSWNTLQESLGKMFASVLSAVPAQVSLAIWYSEPNDRAQRRLLRAAINAGALDNTTYASKLPPTAKDNLLWLLEAADKLGTRRDQALHAPVTYDLTEENVAMKAAYFQGNPLAIQLRDKDLMKEFELSARRANLLALYAFKVCFALTEQVVPWPDKPTLQSHETPRPPKG